MAIKERRTKILSALFLVSDVSFDFVPFTQAIQTIFDLTFNQKTRGTIAGLIKEGAIEKSPDTKDQTPQPVEMNQTIPETPPVVSETQAETPTQTASPSEPLAQSQEPEEQPDDTSVNSYKLTEKGFYELCLQFPAFRYMKDNWDGKWRILSYEIPEVKRELRDKLRREVSGWGLGPWHRSFWLTPHPIIPNLKQLISQKEEEAYVQAFESEHVFGNREILIEKVWQKSALDKQYRDIFKNWHEALSKDQDKPTKMKTIVDQYLDVLRIDPGLPAELVGKTWIGFEAFQIFKEIRGILLS